MEVQSINAEGRRMQSIVNDPERGGCRVGNARHPMSKHRVSLPEVVPQAMLMEVLGTYAELSEVAPDV